MQKNSPDASDVHLGNVDWEQLHNTLHSSVSKLVLRSSLSAWRDQKPEVIDDVTQDALLKLVMRFDSIERGESPPIDCLDRFSKVVAHHCFINAYRKDRVYLKRSTYDDGVSEMDEPINHEDPAELAIANLHTEHILTKAATEIVKFPRKQKTALLIDLAWLCAFDEEIEPLPVVLLNHGIQLQDYRQQLPADPVIRGRHAALLTLAYKRLAVVYASSALALPAA